MQNAKFRPARRRAAEPFRTFHFALLLFHSLRAPGMSEPLSTPAAQPPGTWRRLLRNPVAVAAMTILAAIAFVAVFGPSIFPPAPVAEEMRQPERPAYSPEKVNPRSLHPPSWL